MKEVIEAYRGLSAKTKIALRDQFVNTFTILKNHARHENVAEREP